jgi:hypothetical protein
MRCLRSCLWLSVFLLGAALPAFCQGGIVPPNGSGFRIPENIGTANFVQTVFSTGPYDSFLLVFQNGVPKFAAGATVCTTGPLSTVSIPVPFGCFGLQSGDIIAFMFWVRHRTTEGGTTSLILSVIPVGSDGGTTTPPPPTGPGSKLLPEEGDALPRWARREENLFG